MMSPGCGGHYSRSPVSPLEIGREVKSQIRKEWTYMHDLLSFLLGPTIARVHE